MNIVEKHKGDAALNQIHAHQDKAKYLFMSSDKIVRSYEHDHSAMNIANLEEHLRNAHKGQELVPEVDETHEHQNKMKDKTSNYAALIDLNPLAAALGQDAEVWFFVIEGSFKAAAVLSEIVETGVKASVASVPSVSLWMGAKELQDFAKLVGDKPVVIVPDADWAKNADVNSFAFFCKSRLMSYGVKDVYVAAPPVGKDKKALWGMNPYPYPKGSEPVPERLKGIDDFLGFGNGVLSDLIVRDVIPPDAKTLAALVSKELFFASGGRKPSAAQVANCVKVLTALSVFSGGIEMTDKCIGPGMVQKTLTSIANAVGMDAKSVARVLVYLESIEFILIEGDFSALKGDPALIEQEMVPVIQIDPKFQSTLSDAVRLGDYFPFLH